MRVFLYILFVTLASCSVDPRLQKPPVLLAREDAEVPSYVPAAKYAFQDNPWTQPGFELGRALFYENMLSSDNSVSCGSCHQQAAAFANADHRLSHGVNDQLGNRNSPGIFNLAWHPYFMHDGGINHIEVQPLGPIMNPVEMNADLATVISRLSASARYRALFKAAYGNEEINSQKMLKAFAQFMGKMNSFGSKYDAHRRDASATPFSAEELRGFDLFLQKCNSCHTEPLFSDFVIRSNGLLPDPALQDSGRAHITGSVSDLFRFKTPSLRNVGVTGPYMHDGRFSTLEQCLDHYSDGNLHPVNLDNGLPLSGIPLSPQEKKDIILFLHTLTDYTFLKNKAFSDPNFAQ